MAKELTDEMKQLIGAQSPNNETSESHEGARKLVHFRHLTSMPLES